MKICFLIDDYSAVGGIQRITPIICNELKKYHEISVVSIYNEHQEINKDLYNGQDIKVLINGKKEYVKQCLKAVSLLRKFLIDNKIELLVACMEMLSPYCYLATKRIKIPFVVWTHTPTFSYDETFLQKPFKYLSAKKAACVVALTKKNCEDWKAHYNTDRAVRIPNPVDPILMKPVDYDEESKKIISVGRICYQKYYEKMAEVASLVFAKNKDWSWDIYGGGDEKEKIEKLIVDNNLENNVFLKGNVSNIYGLYKNYALQVLTSRFEGFPMTLLEGMANGLPLVAFDVAGVGEVIRNGENGFLIPAFDEKEMAEKILLLIENKEKRKEFSNKNIEQREEYNIEFVINEWNEMFKRIKK